MKLKLKSQYQDEVSNRHVDNEEESNQQLAEEHLRDHQLLEVAAEVVVPRKIQLALKKNHLLKVLWKQEAVEAVDEAAKKAKFQLKARGAGADHARSNPQS